MVMAIMLFIIISQASLAVVAEENTSRNVSFQLQRGPGIFGVIGVQWNVS